MDKLKDKIKTLKQVKKLLNKKAKINAMETWNLMGIYNPWYVIKEKGNIIKYSWHGAFLTRQICVIVKWDKKYKKCQLIYNDTKKYSSEKKYLELTKDNIIELENYLHKIDFINYSKIDAGLQLDGSTSELEVKINKKYNEEDDFGCKNNKLIYNFALKLFELAKENPEKI